MRKRRGRLKHSDAPFVSMEGDPDFIERKSNKVLTSPKRSLILRIVNKLKRKDDKAMANNKKQTLTKWQIASIALLTIAAVIGFAVLLGGGLHDILGSMGLSALLFVQAIGPDKILT